MPDAGAVRNQASQAQGCNPSTGARTTKETSPADGVVPTALSSDSNAVQEKYTKKLSHGLN